MRPRDQLFKEDPDRRNYENLLAEVNHQLDKTVAKCAKKSLYKEEQERHHYMAVVPSVVKDKGVAEVSLKHIKQKLAKIDEGSNYKEKHQRLADYLTGICDYNFNNLFMLIFTGKIKKHVLPQLNMEKEISPSNRK